MSYLRKVGLVVAIFAATLAMSKQASAAVLTLNDGADVRTLTVATGCTTCAVQLKVEFGKIGTLDSSHEGDLLSSVQWSIEPPELMPQTSANIGFNATTAGTTSNWTFILANLNAGDCSYGGSTSKACGDWVKVTAADSTFGFGPITNGTSYTWSFNTTFGSQLPTTLTSGNVRASFNTTGGQNAGNFSPGGGNFGGGGGGGGGVTVPEPASLLLFGMAAFGSAYRVRRRRSA